MGWAHDICGRREIHARFWQDEVKERDHLEPRHRWEDNIKLHLKEMGWEGMD
jgi:hypothetical protein